jgi:hypothetical protein
MPRLRLRYAFSAFRLSEDAPERESRYYHPMLARLPSAPIAPRRILLRAGLGSVLAMFLATASLSAAETDGPYVLPDGKGGWLAWDCTLDKSVDKAVSHHVQAGDLLTIAAIGAQPAFSVKLRPPAANEPDEAPLPSGVPLFIMADSHGQYEIATRLLQQGGVIDSALHWSFGRGRLVILGDVFDRGPHHTEIYWLIYQLEAEAAAAGGRVHFVLGNHEVMELIGDDRYLNPRYDETVRALGKTDYLQLWTKDTWLGQWLRTKPTVFKLGPLLCLHGGISATVVRQQWPVARINRTIRAWLNGELPKTDPDVQFIYGPLGPLWYRGYFPNMPKLAQATPAEIESIRAYYHVDRIAVGHTIIPHVIPLFGGQVVGVDVNMEHDDQGRPLAEGILVQGRDWLRVKVDGTREPLALPPLTY